MGENQLPLRMRITEMAVDLLPEDHPDLHSFRVTVAERSPGLYAVCRGPMVLNTDEEWELEPTPSSRDEVFLARTRFSYTEAIHLAHVIAPKVEINGRTAAEVAFRAIPE